MDQHSVPRQITTFEFKLIGFLTLRQFIYLIIFFPAGFILYKIFPLPLFNIILAGILWGAGLALAFVPINDRPLEVWIKNFIKRIISPTQYFYQKQNNPLYFLSDLYFVADPHRAMTHIESQEKLTTYLSKKKSLDKRDENRQTIANLLQKPTESLSWSKKAAVPLQQSRQRRDGSEGQLLGGEKKPFFTGLVKNHKLIPLPGMLIYVKDLQGRVVRLLKTNPHGVFATFNPLAEGEYLFEIKDPKNSYSFDTMKIRVSNQNTKPLEFFSKELL